VWVIWFITAWNTHWLDFIWGGLIYSLGGLEPPKPMAGYVPDDKTVWMCGLTEYCYVAYTSVFSMCHMWRSDALGIMSGEFGNGMPEPWEENNVIGHQKVRSVGLLLVYCSYTFYAVIVMLCSGKWGWRKKGVSGQDVPARQGQGVSYDDWNANFTGTLIHNASLVSPLLWLRPLTHCATSVIKIAAYCDMIYCNSH